jgi:hypothetical protein
VSRPLARYTPSRRYLSLTIFALFGALFSAWMALHWPPCWIPAALFGASALALASVVLRPIIEIHDTHLRIGQRLITWNEIARVDQTSWQSPLAAHLTLSDGERILILYPGDADSSSSLLRDLRRFAREALLDGVSYREYWGEPVTVPPPAAAQTHSVPDKYPLLRPEDEEEVERMFHQLKSAGRIETRNSDED